MKKILLLICILLLCGCGTKTMKCTSKNEQQKYTLTSEYTINYKGSVVKSVNTVETFESSDTELLSKTENSFNKTFEKNNELYGGYDYKVTNSNGKVVSTVTVDYNKMDLEKFIKDNEAMKAYVNDKNQVTLEGIKKLYESTGAKCE